MLNYRHAQLRRRAEQGERIEAAEYLVHASHFRHIGDEGDAIRVPLLPGAERAFRPHLVWKGFRHVDFTWWHRVRLFTAWNARRVLMLRRDGHRRS